MYGEYEIRTLPLTLSSSRQRVERFLAANGLRLDPLDYYAVVTHVDDEEILAGGGLQGNVIKCVAVSDELRGTGMMQSLLSHLPSTATIRCVCSPSLTIATSSRVWDFAYWPSRPKPS